MRRFLPADRFDLPRVRPVSTAHDTGAFVYIDGRHGY
jgi:hypothetical protein